MLHLQVPNVFFDVFEDGDFDSLLMPSNRCGMDYRRAPLASSPFFAPAKPQPAPAPADRSLNFRKRMSPAKAPAQPEPKRAVAEPELFSASFDLKSFEPSEICVKMENKCLVVSGKHEQRLADGHYEYHQYLKKVPLPENALLDQVKCQLDQDGQLIITAPVKAATVQSMVTEQQLPEVSKPAPVSPVPEPKVESNPDVVIEDIGPDDE